MSEQPCIYRTSLDGEHWTMIEAKNRDEAAEIGDRIHPDDSFYIGQFTRAGLTKSEFVDREYKRND